MVRSLFFKLTISGDELDPEQPAIKVDLPCHIYKKGEVHPFRVPGVICGPQKTNRWVFYACRSGDVNVSGFLTQNLLLIKSNLSNLASFLKKYKANIEYTIYADNKTDIVLSKRQLELLNTIGVKFSIHFC